MGLRHTRAVMGLRRTRAHGHVEIPPFLVQAAVTGAADCHSPKSGTAVQSIARSPKSGTAVQSIVVQSIAGTNHIAV